ncbi:hypothetical protein BN871_BO_00020 [Paenibacillus sp. P22]|nr:hypothetical protein BN871_BO_00020 [Paenibacillus sp. P22]
MQARRVVLRLALRNGGLVHGERIMLLGAHREGPQAARIGRNVGPEHAHDREYFLHVSVDALDEVGLEPRVVRLGDEQAVVLQRLVDALVEAAREQVGRRADRLGGVDHDDVVLVLMVVDMHEAVVHMDLDAGVVQSGCDVRQIFLGVFNDLAVDVDKHDPLDLLMLEDLAHDAAVAAADHEHLLRIRMRVEGRVSDHLMVDELVLVRRHDHAVEDEHRAEFIGLDHGELLEVRLLVDVGFFDFGRNAVGFGLFLGIPQFHGKSPFFLLQVGDGRTVHRMLTAPASRLKQYGLASDGMAHVCDGATRLYVLKAISSRARTRSAGMPAKALAHPFLPFKGDTAKEAFVGSASLRSTVQPVL